MTAEPLRPQTASSARVSIDSPNWSFEPFWPGDRLLVRLAGESVELTDPDAMAVTDAYRELGAALPAAVDAESAVLDGIWTAQPFIGAVVERLDDGDDEAAAAALERARHDDRRAFVVVDLLEIDGTSLLDVPYQERRRLLGSVVREDGHVRLTPAVKVPVNSWFHAWRTNGFEQAVAKQVNSRYLPGALNPDWIIVPLRTDLPRGATRLLWKGRKPRQITD